MDQESSAYSESDVSTAYWIEWFLSLKGNEFFCEIDEDYINDRFNLTGISSEVPHYQDAFALMTDNLDADHDLDTLPDNMRMEIETSARHLYGLIHARFIITTRGLVKMFEKFRHAEFGRCPRVLCHNQAVLPVGLSDVPGYRSVMLFCPRCEDCYAPPSRRHAVVDGAYFGTTFPHLLIQVYPQLMPTKPNDRYVPKIFGFKIHTIAEEERKQDQIREEQAARLLAITNASE
ncbi:casein kinase 2 regulatory subunit [Podochytrium sp. JEL0797]|nr:casein kinase 2 regulatory subunit [Podochytrium sp. JEL0797]